jgi:purine-cytosine permease-like protein
VEEESSESPVWGGVLVAIGLMILVNNLGWINLAALQRYWPILLILVGGFFLYRSTQGKKSAPPREESFRDRID